MAKSKRKSSTDSSESPQVEKEHVERQASEAEDSDATVEVIVESDSDNESKAETEATDESPSELADQVFALNSQLTELKDKYVRAAAEHENYRKRMNGELERARKFAVDRFAREMLEVMESLDRACALSSGNDEDFVLTAEAIREGVELTRKQMLDKLALFEIEEIFPQPGDAFDVNLHEAMTMQPSSEIAPNCVLETFRKGYKIHDRLLRPAMVVIASAPSPQADAEDESQES